MKPFTIFKFLGLFFLALSLLVSYLFGIRPKNKAKRCSCKIKGTVIGPSLYSYNDTIRIPLVEYRVNGRRYRVVGPKFKSVVTTNVQTPFNNPKTQYKSNLTSADNLPEHLEIHSRTNSFARVYNSPLMELFPVGTQVDVYYNPRKPKESFVIRYFPPPTFLRILLYSLTFFILVLNIVLWFI